jgi:hypothetical protein
MIILSRTASAEGRSGETLLSAKGRLRMEARFLVTALGTTTRSE